MRNIFKDNGTTLNLDDQSRLRVDGLKQLPPDRADQIREYIRQHKPQIILELVQTQHRALWKKAWALADWIDAVNGAPIEIRRGKLPELQEMIRELSRLEKLGARPTR